MIRLRIGVQLKFTYIFFGQNEPMLTTSILESSNGFRLGSAGMGSSYLRPESLKAMDEYVYILKIIIINSIYAVTDARAEQKRNNTIANLQ